MKLKAIFSLVVLMSFFIGMTSTAQIQVGAKIGANGTTLAYGDFDIKDIKPDSLDVDFPNLAETEFKFGLHAGAFAIIDLGAVNIMPEALWSMKGAKNFGTSASGKSLDVALHYLSVPVLIGIDIADIFTLQVGPQFGFLLASQAKVEGEDSYDIRDTYGYKSTDLGAVIGVMFQWPNVGHVSARYNLGLMPAQSLSNFRGDEFKYFNRTLQVGLGIPLYKTDNE